MLQRLVCKDFSLWRRAEGFRALFIRAAGAAVMNLPVWCKRRSGAAQIAVFAPDQHITG
jgi:hypothetical protein